jgi:hypothetical protein
MVSAGARFKLGEIRSDEIGFRALSLSPGVIAVVLLFFRARIKAWGHFTGKMISAPVGTPGLRSKNPRENPGRTRFILVFGPFEKQNRRQVQAGDCGE